MDDAERGRLVAFLAAEFEVQNGIDVTHDETAMNRLREAAERAAADPTSAHEVNLPFLATDETGPKHFHVVLAKKRIDDIRAGREGPPHVDRTRRSVPPPRERESRTSEPPKQSSSTMLLVVAIIVALAFAAIAFTYASSHHDHDHDDGHGQEHKH